MEYNRYNIALLCTSAGYFYIWVAFALALYIPVLINMVYFLSIFLQIHTILCLNSNSFEILSFSQTYSSFSAHLLRSFWRLHLQLRSEIFRR